MKPALKILNSALLIVGSVLFAFALTEAVLRLFPSLLSEGARLRIHWRGDGEPWHVAHPYIGHLHTSDADPNLRTGRPAVETDKQDRWGFRNDWPWPARAEIIAVGDSLTYSQTVKDDQAWTFVLAQSLPRSKVLNLGLIGGAPQQYLRIYETFGINLAPKVLLVGLFLSNDIDGARKFDLWWKKGGKGSFPEFGRPANKRGVRNRIEAELRKTYLGIVLQDLRESYQAGRFMAGKRMNLGDGGQVELVPSLLSRVAVTGQPDNPGFTIVLDTLERIHSIAQKHNTHCLVLFLPSKEEVYLPLLGEKVTDLAAPFIAELQSRNISYLNLGPHFRRRAAAGETLFWEVDGHPNPGGYSVVAKEVLSHLKANAKRYGLKDWEEEPSKLKS